MEECRRRVLPSQVTSTVGRLATPELPFVQPAPVVQPTPVIGLTLASSNPTPRTPANIQRTPPHICSVTLVSSNPTPRTPPNTQRTQPHIRSVVRHWIPPAPQLTPASSPPFRPLLDASRSQRSFSPPLWPTGEESPTGDRLFPFTASGDGESFPFMTSPITTKRKGPMQYSPSPPPELPLPPHVPLDLLLLSPARAPLSAAQLHPPAESPGRLVRPLPSRAANAVSPLPSPLRAAPKAISVDVSQWPGHDQCARSYLLYGVPKGPTGTLVERGWGAEWPLCVELFGKFQKLWGFPVSQGFYMYHLSAYIGYRQIGLPFRRS